MKLKIAKSKNMFMKEIFSQNKAGIVVGGILATLISSIIVYKKQGKPLDYAIYGVPSLLVGSFAGYALNQVLKTSTNNIKNVDQVVLTKRF